MGERNNSQPHGKKCPGEVVMKYVLVSSIFKILLDNTDSTDNNETSLWAFFIIFQNPEASYSLPEFKRRAVPGSLTFF